MDPLDRARGIGLSESSSEEDDDDDDQDDQGSDLTPLEESADLWNARDDEVNVPKSEATSRR